MKKLLTAVAIATITTLPQLSYAESGFNIGATPSVDADVNFSIIIPEILFFQVGTFGATIDTITFDLSAVDVGDSTSIAGTGGDQGGGKVSVVIRSNAGAVTISTAVTGGGSGLSDGGSNNISFAEIDTVQGGAEIAPPALDDAGGTTSLIAVTSGNITNETDDWTYSYDNTTVPEAGTYTGTVTYTASAP